MSTLEKLILELPQDLQQEVEDFVRFLLRKHAGTSSQDEAGATKDYRGQYRAKQAATEPADSISILYQKQIKPLAVTDRLHLMQLIIAELAESASGWVVEESSAWSHEDLLDLGRASLQYAGKTLPGEEHDAQSR
jgi:Protein of unknown function (DUF2281)